jgi:uncharacterized protein (TIGR03437 family)
MKTAMLFILTLAVCLGQNAFTTFAGTGAAIFSGDGGPAISATLANPLGVAADGAGNVYIADLNNHRVRKVNAAGIISTLAGNGSPGVAGDGGPAINAQLFSVASVSSSLQGLAADNAGNVYITDSFNHRVRKVAPDGTISLFAGSGLLPGDGGLATKAGLSAPTGVSLDAVGNVYIADNLGGRIRKVDTAGMITTIAGTGVGGFSGDGGPAIRAQLIPEAVAVDQAGNVYFTDSVSRRIRKVNTAGIISTVAGNGSSGFPQGDGVPATSAVLFEPEGLAVDNAGNLYVADAIRTGPGIDRPAIRKIDTNGIITTITGATAATTLINVGDVAADSAGNLYFTEGNRIRKLGAPPPPTPVILSSDIVNGASFQPGIVANSWVTIKGTNLASTTTTWDNAIVNGKLPTVLAGVSVSMNGKPAYIYFVSPGQINVLAPDLSPGPVAVFVTNLGATSAPVNATATLHGPAFFPWPGNQPVATRQDFTYAVKAGTFPGAATVSAKRGEVIILWATGFGPTNPVAPVSTAVPSDKAYSTATTPSVAINNIPVVVFGAALAPGAAGLYQIAIQIPDALADGDWPIRASIGGVQSPAGMVLTVSH